MDTQSAEDDDVMENFMERFKAEKYEGAFNEESWEQNVQFLERIEYLFLSTLSKEEATEHMEFDTIPMFMKKAPSNIDPEKAPALACLQSMLFDSDRSPEEQAKSFKDEGNEYFKEKSYVKAIASYTEGMKKKCTDQELNAVLYTNRAAAHFYIGNYRSAINDVISARKLKPNHLKAVIRGALCYMEIKNYPDVLKWCDEGLRINPSDRKLLETRAKADKLLRTAERDARKSRVLEKKKREDTESLLAAVKYRGIQLHQRHHNKEETDEDSGSHKLSGLFYDGVSSENAIGAHVFLDESGRLNWPVLFFYPEHGQTDFISAFHEDSRFIEHLNEMFAEDFPSWDSERKYCVQNLEIYFEDEITQSFYEVNPESSLLQTLQHQRFLVKAGTPSFLIFVKQSPFSKKYLSDRKIFRLSTDK